MTKASDNVFPKLLNSLNTSDPAAPSDSSWKLYAKANGIFARSSNTVVGPFGAASVGASGGFIWLQRQTASSSAQIDLTTVITTTYETYKVEGTFAPATNAVNLLLRFGTGGGPTIDTGANYYGLLRSTTGTSTGAAKTNTDSAATSIMLAKAIGNAAGGYANAGFSLTFRNLSSSTFMKQVDGTVTWHDGTEFFTAQFGGAYASVTAVTALRFFMSSGNIASGQVDIYGLAKS